MSGSPRIAVTSRSFCRNAQLRAELLARYPDARLNIAGASLRDGELIAFLNGYDAAIIALERIDAELLSALPQLKTISKFGVGLDNIDLHAAAQAGVRIGWTGGVNRRSVAELVISNAIALLRQVGQANALVRAGGWAQIQGRQLSSAIVGIIGCGHVGKEVARLLQPFGCRILSHDIRDFPEFYAEAGIEPISLNDLLRTADVVTVHLPLTPRTRLLLDRDQLALMKPTAILINAARGGIVDEMAVKERLIAGQLAGAAFDVFAIEPPVDQELLLLPNFLATPHIGGSAVEAILAMGRAAIDGLDHAADPLGYLETI